MTVKIAIPIAILFKSLDFDLTVNQAFQFLKANSLLILRTLKWGSVISRCPISTKFTSSYDFSNAPVFSILKLYLAVFAVYSNHHSSFINVKSNI